MIHTIDKFRVDIGEILGYFPCSRAIFGERMVPGDYVAIYLRNSPDTIKLGFNSEEERDVFLEDLDKAVRSIKI